MKREMPKKQLSVKDMSAAKHVNLQINSLREVKGGNVVVEDVFGF